MCIILTLPHSLSGFPSFFRPTQINHCCLNWRYNWFTHQKHLAPASSTCISFIVGITQITVLSKESFLHSLTEGKENRKKDYAVSLAKQRSGIFRVENYTCQWVQLNQQPSAFCYLLPAVWTWLSNLVLGPTSGPHPNVPQPQDQMPSFPTSTICFVYLSFWEKRHFCGLKIFFIHSFMKGLRCSGFFSSEHLK